MEELQLKKISKWDALYQDLMKDHGRKPIKLSVVIPTFNQAHVLDATLASIISQERSRKEIIVIDANSQDHTLSILEKYESYIYRVYFVTQTDLAFMCNKGASLATGEYISFVFPGRTYLSHFTMYHISMLIEDKDFPDLIYGATYIEDRLKEEPSSQALPLNKKNLRKGIFPTHPSCLWFKLASFKQLGGMNSAYVFGVHQNYVFRKGVFFWQPARQMIFDLLCRLYKSKNVRVASTPRALLYYSLKEEPSSFFLGDYFGRWRLVFKYFGPFYGIKWLFSKKSFKLIPWVYRRIRLMFVGS